MRYWFDTEFIDDGRTIELISIGLCSEDGRTYYAQSTEFAPERCNAWVTAHVLPHLEPPGAASWKPRQQIADDVRTFVGRRAPEFWAYYASYDWVVLSQLYGALHERPKSWPLRCRDVAEWAALWPDVERPTEPDPAHHALADAQWAKAFWLRLDARSQAHPESETRADQR